MSDWYFASLLVTAGACLGFALHAVDLAFQKRGRSYVYLVALSLLEGAYCLVAYRYLRETSPERALRWGQSICAFTPYITCVFGELAFTMTDHRPRWLVVGRKLNLVLTTLFALGVIADMVFQRELMLRSFLITDLASAHRHRLVFTPMGIVWLIWVSISFTSISAALFKAPRARREFAPIAVGCGVYFVATLLDFGIFVELRDGYFLQHLGFLALILGCWRVLGRRLELSIRDQEVAVVRLEEQRQRLLLAAPLMHKQKLDSLGTLAAGVAHEINNPIHGILNYVQLLKRGIPIEAKERGFAEEIEREAKRIAEIVRHLLYFGRADETHAIAADVRDIVTDTLVLLRGPLRDDKITLDVRVDDDVRDIVCRIHQLQQILMNLIMNARDALNRRSPERTDDKIIVIRVGTPPSKPGWVSFEVVDNGDGFDEETAERVFDPFFTTKPPGEGTGLGLSISHGIARAHGGTMSCESQRGRQTSFRVDLPSTPPDIIRVDRETPHALSQDAGG
ncbi:MAG TPA: ATP-binding protein [Labilithrix sp.]|nr:ATP-binding protein [Labilithrix sp.]